MKDHEISKTLNELTKTARQFAETQQLRDRLSRIVVPLLRQPGAFAKGLAAAALFLEQTAQDFEQMADHIQADLNSSPKTGIGDSRRQTMGSLKEKAALLRGQAKHIKELKE